MLIRVLTRIEAGKPVTHVWRVTLQAATRVKFELALKVVVSATRLCARKTGKK
jgi:hypothetical protein